MTKLNVLTSAILAVALTAGPSLAAGTAATAMSPAAGSTYTEKQLIGLNVVNKRGGEVGFIKAVNLDRGTGNINFIIVATSNKQGDVHALPLDNLAINSGTGKATLLIPADKMAKAEAYPIQVSCTAGQDKVWNSIYE
jgi:sporulation protein YlmC with PRC-barrel domain